MPTMKGRVLDKSRVDALDYCHMVTATTSRFHLCRQKECRFFSLEENWANTVKDRLASLNRIVAGAISCLLSWRV